MFWKRKPRRDAGARERQSHDDDHAVQLSVPGYGSPPVTKPHGAGPQPSQYGLPPDVDEWPEQRHSR